MYEYVKQTNPSLIYVRMPKLLTLSRSCARVCYLGRTTGGLGLGSVNGYRRPEVCLTTSLFLEQGLVAPFCGAGVFVDRDSSSFQDHRTSRVNQRVQAKMATQDERTREGITHTHECSCAFMRRRGAWARPNAPSSQVAEHTRKGTRT